MIKYGTNKIANNRLNTRVELWRLDKTNDAYGAETSVIIDYTTKKKEVDADAEKMAVLALTSLIYDGVTDRSVWNSVITNYLAHKLPL